MVVKIRMYGQLRNFYINGRKHSSYLNYNKRSLNNRLNTTRKRRKSFCVKENVNQEFYGKSVYGDF